MAEERKTHRIEMTEGKKHYSAASSEVRYRNC